MNVRHGWPGPNACLSWRSAQAAVAPCPVPSLPFFACDEITAAAGTLGAARFSPSTVFRTGHPGCAVAAAFVAGPQPQRLNRPRQASSRRRSLRHTQTSDVGASASASALPLLCLCRTGSPRSMRAAFGFDAARGDWPPAAQEAPINTTP
jgi:hypothetical protein